FRNNIVVDYGGNGPSVIRPPIQFGNKLSGGAYSNCDATCTGWLSTDAFDHNIFSMNNGNISTNVLLAAPNFYTCAGAAAVTTMTNCTFADPLFVAASPSFWNNISQFNLHLQSGSPAIAAGTKVGAPETDNIG